MERDKKIEKKSKTNKSKKKSKQKKKTTNLQKVWNVLKIVWIWCQAHRSSLIFKKLPVPALSPSSN